MATSLRQLASIEVDPAAFAAPSFAEIISALSFALDLTEGAVPGHALRSCLLGVRLGHELGLADDSMADLYHALLLKDVGCSSNAARMCQIIGGGDDRAMKNGAKLEDWTKPHKPTLSGARLLWKNVLPGEGPAAKVRQMVKVLLSQHQNNEEMITLRCDRGASIVRKIGMSEQAAEAVRSLDEHWDGSGYPERRSKRGIPLLARIMAVAQHLDVFAHDRGTHNAMTVLAERSGSWFDPDVVRAAEALHRRGALWMYCLPNPQVSAERSELYTRSAVLDFAPAESTRPSAAHIDTICEAFAEVVDAKSNFTFRHSVGVTDVAASLGKAMGLSLDRQQLLHRAALLHDLGKLRVPNSILDKPGKLDSTEWSVMQEHPALTRDILNRIRPFRELAHIAGAHHEKLDGSGYPDRLHAEDLPIEARILAVSDVYGALVEDRPYRGGFDIDRALGIMRQDAAVKLDGDCFDALSGIANSVNKEVQAPFLVPPREVPVTIAEDVHPRPRIALAR